MMSIGSGTLQFLHYCSLRQIRKFGTRAYWEGKQKSCLLKGEFIFTKAERDQQIQLLIRVPLFSGEQKTDETKKI